MTSIITAWLVKLATRILRDKLTDKDDEIDHLSQRASYLETENRQFVESRNRFFHEVSQLGKQVTEYKDNNLILGIRVENLQVELEKLRTDNDVLRGAGEKPGCDHQGLSGGGERTASLC